MGYKQAVAAVKASMGMSAAAPGHEISGIAIARAARERDEALSFYDGDQWPIEARFRRMQQGRPCLVCNHIPQIVRDFQALNGPAIKEIDLIMSVVRIYRDRQVMHNYLVSAQAEGRLEQALRPGFDLVRGYTPKIGDTIRVRRPERFVAHRAFGEVPPEKYDLWTLLRCDDKFGIVTGQSFIEG